MYYPYIRGKQFELAALEELASKQKLQSRRVHPVIEPVRFNMAKLTATLRTLSQEQIDSYLVLNPIVGEFKGDDNALFNFYHANQDQLRIIPTIIISSGTEGKQIVSLIKENIPNTDKIALIIWKNTEFRQTDIDALNFQDKELELFFYQVPEVGIKQFNCKNKILIFDGFNKQAKNADYPETDYFSDFPLVYKERGYFGFGDFQTIGERYSESGGPASAVAIHLTYSNTELYGVLECKHFVSDDGAVVAEWYITALSKLIEFKNRNGDVLVDSLGLQGLSDLYGRKHFPGLGVLKKLSIMHHIETVTSIIQ